ncbi:MAG: hypothetical protein ACE5SW_04265 [Nitrososphaeraceae archaeon]
MCFEYEIPEKLRIKYKKLLKEKEEIDSEKQKEIDIIVVSK